MPEQLTYFTLLVTWALPPILLQWFAGWRWLKQHPRAWLLGILLPTFWLVLADSTALGIVWTIAPQKSSGIFLGNVPAEEILFFLLTNTLVTQSFLLLYHARDMQTQWRIAFNQHFSGTKKSHESSS